MSILFLQPDALFIEGLLLDIIGVLILARGSFMPPSEILRLSSSFFDRDPQRAANLIKNRSDTHSGVVFLVLGFSAQLFSRFVASPTNTHPVKAEELIAFAAIILLVAGFVFFVYHLVREYVEMKISRNVAIDFYKNSPKELGEDGAISQSVRFYEEIIRTLGHKGTYTADAKRELIEKIGKINRRRKLKKKRLP